MDKTTWPDIVTEPLAWLNGRIESGKPACYLRFNDGEFYSIFGMKTAPESNGEHDYSDEVRYSLLRTFITACTTGTAVRIGSWWYEDPSHPAVARAIEFLRVTGLTNRVNWARGHIYHREEGNCPDAELLRFVRNVQKLKGRRHFPTVLIGNESLAPVAKGLGCDFAAIPAVNAYESPPIFRKEYGLSIWCGGFPCKEWAWDCWKGWKSKWVIDAGSLFDGLVGNVSREWLRLGSGPHSDFYYGDFKKAVLGG